MRPRELGAGLGVPIYLVGQVTMGTSFAMTPVHIHNPCCWLRLAVGGRALPWLCFICLLLQGTRSWSSDAVAFSRINAAAQERIAELLQDAFGPSHSESESAPSSPAAVAQRLIALEGTLREAADLMPARLDLRFGIASTQVLQAIQTNFVFQTRMSEALEVYQEIQWLDLQGFDAGILYAAYSRALGFHGAAQAAVERLMTYHPDRTCEYVERFHRLDRVLQVSPDPQPRLTMPQTALHAIVILGAALETNGTIKPKLVGRLEQGLKLAALYPQAPIVVTGGNQRRGLTEAYAMRAWLEERGVGPSRLHLEDRARDTVGNALFSCVLLQRLGVTHATLVTSASHIRRALADFEEAAWQRGLALTLAHLAAAEEFAPEAERERVAVYRDVMRASGLWAFPGLQR